MDLKSMFKFFYRSPKSFSRKQWIFIAAWCVVNVIAMFLYISAGASFVLALFNCLYGIAIIFGYFTRLFAFAISPIIWAFLYVLNFFKNPSERAVFEWSDALWFATIAATVIRGYFIEAYTIPTSSMEKSLLIGDFLFVSKANYGNRLPITSITFPFAHNQLPMVDSIPSYLDWMQMPYFRLPAFQKIKNGDVVVFNYPSRTGSNPLDIANEQRPIDKRDNYIKRCVGIPGDSLKVINSQLYINGKAVPLSENGMISYNVATEGNLNLPLKKLREAGLRVFDIRNNDQLEFAASNGADVLPYFNGSDYTCTMNLSGKLYDKVKGMSGIVKLDSAITLPEVDGTRHYSRCYPYETDFGWNRDYYGSIYIPKKGDVIKLDSFTYWMYKRPIQLYENNATFEMRDGKFYMEGKEITTYTFKYDYYFMMGDNRHNSDDSRFWGFVPQTHIVGKAMFIWMSWDSFADKWYNKVRWNRLFRGIN